MKKSYKYIISFCIIIISFLLIGNRIRESLATVTVHSISNFDELLAAAELSRTEAHRADIFELESDITITEDEILLMDENSINFISFGSSDFPFIGTFDGKNHSINNLSYDSTLKVQADTGLFSYTGSGAVIKNIILDGAEIEADYRGGLIAGHSEGTLFENIVVKNSHLKVAATDNVLTLVTDGGIRGGAIVGEAVDSVLYNVESNNNIVNTNNTSGVAALGGKPLTLGGLVGISEGTTIEYSRVIDGTVKSYYDVAVGAVGGNSLYVGGIVGQMRTTSKVIDSFSTATLYYYCGTYVSVAAGNAGYIGGIAAKMDGTQGEIHRSHYAGVATSKQYNAVLVIPIVQSNVNVSGLVNVFNGGSVTNAYFKPSANNGVKMTVLGSASSTSSYGPVEDSDYSNIDFWLNSNYDFFGNISRNTEYNSNHYNKWIMDYNKGIPVHGKSAMATLDFPNAGEVIINKSELIESGVNTKDAYTFAVQGFSTSERQIKLTANENDGYKFIGWYKKNNAITWKIEENHDYFENLYNENNILSTNLDYSTEFNDNDLFIAHYKTNVIYHDINGNIISPNDGHTIVDKDSDINYYEYGEKISDFIPVNRPDSDNAVLIGWTTTKSDEAGGGYKSITHSQLSNLEATNAFYESGESIVETLDLYPVYKDLSSNIITVFEGNEQDSSSDISLRVGVGKTFASVNDNEVILTMLGSDEGNLPEGYQFLGWFDENNNLVSNEFVYSFSLNDIDLNDTHTYTAKFLYKIEYYVKRTLNSDAGVYNNGALYAERWQRYNTAFDNIDGLDFYREVFDHWGPDDYQNTEVYNENIVGYTKVYSMNVRGYSGTGTVNYTVDLNSDFPGAGRIAQTNTTSQLAVNVTYDSNDYNFIGWTLTSTGSTKSNGLDESHNFGVISNIYKYVYTASFTANIRFHQMDGSIDTVTRLYKENILLTDNVTHTYDNIKSDGEKVSVVSLKTPDAYYDNDYYFIGWIDKSKYDTDSLNALYDTDEQYVTTSISKAKNYIIKNSDEVYSSMDLYPVYAKFNVVTSTNVPATSLTSINKPNVPNFVIEQTSNGKAIVKLAVDRATFVTNDSDKKYELISLINVDTNEYLNEDENGLYTYEIEAGGINHFKAIYVPYVVVYHLNNSNSEVSIKNQNETYGEMPIPTFDLSLIDDSKKYIFVGWTSSIPQDGYFKFSNSNEIKHNNIKLLSSSMIVNSSVELYPVYISINISLNSNIDDNLSNPNSIRYISRPSNSEVVINASDVTSYEFKGWYKNYVSMEDKGILVTNNSTYTLDTNIVNENELYTAVYEKIYLVNYHDKDGNVIYTEKVGQTEDRSFVNVGIDGNGNEVEVLSDPEAYINLQNTLSSNEVFVEYNLHSNSTITKWKDFYNKKIVSDMDLYPVIRTVNVTDKNLNNINDKISLVSDDNMDILLNEEYYDDEINILVEDILYVNSSNYKTKVKNLDINVYRNDNLLGSDTTNSNGISTIKLYGYIVLSNNIDSSYTDDVYLFNIYDSNDNLLNTIDVNYGEDLSIKVPYGNYKIEFDNNWIWRYGDILNEDVNITSDNINQNIEYSNNSINTKWFGKTNIKHNVYN